MEMLKLVIAFAALMIVIIVFKKPLWLAALIGCGAAWIVFQIPVMDGLETVWKAVSAEATIEVVAIIYLINVLQLLLVRRGNIARAEQSLLRLFNNRRAIVMMAPVLFGLLPVPNAVVLSAPIVDSTIGDDLGPVDKAYLTSYYRHVPESALPLYSNIILACSVVELSSSKFLLYMLPMALVGMFVPYFQVLRPHVSASTGQKGYGDKKGEVIALCKSLWPIILLILVVVALGYKTSLCTLVLLAVLFILYKTPLSEIKTLVIKGFNANMIFSTALLMVFKELLAYTGIVEKMPELFGQLPIPTFLIFALLMFVGGFTGLSTALMMIALPLAFAAIPESGIPLLVLLMCCSHSGLQLSPTHICLEITAEQFHVSLKDLIIRTIPVTVIYLVFLVAYYLLLTAF